MEASPEACRFRDDGLVACILLAVGAVVVYVLYVLIEANVEFPAVGQLVLYGADTSFDVELAYCWIVADDIDERIDRGSTQGLDEEDTTPSRRTGRRYRQRLPLPCF